MFVMKGLAIFCGWHNNCKEARTSNIITSYTRADPVIMGTEEHCKEQGKRKQEFFLASYSMTFLSVRQVKG